MSFTQKGRIISIGQTEKVTETFSKRSFVIEDDDNNYVNIYAFEIVQDKCSVLDAFKEGEDVNVSFNIRCREWNGKHFTNLNAWRIERISAGDTQSAPPKEPAKVESDKGDNDQLPF